MSLKDLINRDIKNIFLNVDDFCEALVLQIGTQRINVIGSLQSNIVNNNSGNNQPLQKCADTLYIKYPLEIAGQDINKLLSSGTRITVDNKPYTIVSVSDELGLATIMLSTSTGR